MSKPKNTQKPQTEQQTQGQQAAQEQVQGQTQAEQKVDTEQQASQQPATDAPNGDAATAQPLDASKEVEKGNYWARLRRPLPMVKRLWNINLVTKKRLKLLRPMLLKKKKQRSKKSL